MTEPIEPIKLAQIEEMNRERLYGLLYAHRRRRGLVAWLCRRRREVCTHTALAQKLPVVAMREAEEMSRLNAPCVVVLFDLETLELAGQWITDPQVEDVRIEELRDSMGGLDA